MAKVIKMRWKAITTDVRGLSKNFDARVWADLGDMARSFESDYKRVTSQFTHPNSPVFKIKFGRGFPPRGGMDSRMPIQIKRVMPTGREFGKALWAGSITENDPIFYYLERGAKRYRFMSADWKSLTRPGQGIKTFPRAGRAGGFGANKVIEPRWFSADVATRNSAKFVAKMERLFHGQAILNFFGQVRYTK